MANLFVQNAWKLNCFWQQKRSWMQRWITENQNGQLIVLVPWFVFPSVLASVWWSFEIHDKLSSTTLYPCLMSYTSTKSCCPLKVQLGGQNDNVNTVSGSLSHNIISINLTLFSYSMIYIQICAPTSRQRRQHKLQSSNLPRNAWAPWHLVSSFPFLVDREFA